MVQLIPSPSKKRIAPINVIGIIVQQKMLGVCFEGYIVNRYGFANDVPRNGLKYIHCDLVDPIRYLIITLILGSNFVCTFSPCLNVRSFIRMLNFKVTFINKIERGDWGFVLKVGAIVVIKQIDLLSLHILYKVSRKGKIYKS